MKAWFSLASAVALAVTLSSTALAQDPPSPRATVDGRPRPREAATDRRSLGEANRRDVRLADEVGRSLEGYARLTIFDDVSAQVENGVVTLVGKVTTPTKKSELERRVARIDGVRELHNRIGVLPVSPADDDLRYRVARAIYGNPAFWTYAAMANPPIHIVVENSRVTLTGVVQSEVDRMLAQSLATGLGELSVTNELRTDLKSNSS